MIANLKTQAGDRPDLEAIQVNPVLGYIGSRIWPIVNATEKTGTVYYKTLTSDAAAQTSRSSETAPTRTMLTDSSTTWSAAEVIKRYGVDYSEVKNMGGIEAADRLGGMASKRSVMRAIETAQAAALFTSGRYSAALDVSADPIEGMLWALDDIKRYRGDAGRIAMVCSLYSWRALIANAKVVAALSYTFTPNVAAPSVLSRSRDVIVQMFQNVLGIDEVLIGDDDHWSISGREQAIGLVALPSADEFSHKMDPVLGKTFLYLPDGKQPYQINSFPDDDVRVNNYDCSAWYAIKEFNSAAAVLVKAGLPAVTTTTTTTTATTTTTTTT